MVQLSHPHMTTGKNIALTIHTFVRKVMSLLFNMLSQFSSVQSLSWVRLFATPWIAAHQASLSITNTQSSLKLISIESVMPSNHLILCCPLLLLPPIPPSFRIFSNESTLCMRRPKYWSFSFNISPSKEIPGLIYFRMDWLDILAVKGTLKSLLQHHSSKASILWCSAFFIVQLSHPHMTTGKTIASTRWTFVDKVISLLFNMLSRLVITFLPRSKRLLISWLQSPSAVILEPRKIVWHCFHCFPIYFPWSDGTGCHDLHWVPSLHLGKQSQDQYLCTWVADSGQRKKSMKCCINCCCSVTQLCLTPWTAAHRPPYPSLSSRVSSDSCPLSWWCRPTISSFVPAFSFCPQSFPASGSFPMSWLFASGGQVLELQHQPFQWMFRVDFL